MRKILILLALILISSLLLGAIANASVNETKKSAKAKVLTQKAKKAGHGEAKAAEGTEGEHETQAAWRIPGWQSIFAIMAVVYYVVISLNFLPKIAAKEVEDKN